MFLFLLSSLLWLENEYREKDYKNSLLCFLYNTTTETNDQVISIPMYTFRDEFLYHSLRTKCIGHDTKHSDNVSGYV